jgi:hypothetical protein
MRAKMPTLEHKACQLVGLFRLMLECALVRSARAQYLQARFIHTAYEQRRFGYQRIQMMLDQRPSRLPELDIPTVKTLIRCYDSSEASGNLGNFASARQAFCLVCNTSARKVSST